MNQRELPTIPYTELPPSKPDAALAEEWEFYRREAGRLLAEGYEGKHILIKGSEILGMWDTDEEAYEFALQRFLIPRQDFMIHQIRAREPVYRVRW